ncbi:MAG: 3-oxoacyl-[acyl-carrier-protein] reductase [Chloroflexota bacterium]|nr:3-oxoacyl-[acyl-carrier-protein] reductase [Chloroflexota bacterium]MDE2969977.1 3-oxoacyl-[acyl-carrier-protein] reductase [Chloroflexota bacterium]
MASDGRVALITGGSRGIGRAIALQLASQGMRIVVNYVSNADAAAEVVKRVEEAGSQAVALQADVTRGEDVERLFAQAAEAFGSVEILVNNAGIIKDSLLMRMSDEDWDSVVDLDLRSVFLCTRAAIRMMVRGRWGRVINIGSVVGLRGNQGQANYAAAKAGLVGFTQSVAKEVASRNVTVNCVAPGYVETDIVEDLPQELKKYIMDRVPVGRFGQPEEISGIVGFLASDAASYITGQAIAVDGGLVIS